MRLERDAAVKESLLIIILLMKFKFYNYEAAKLRGKQKQGQPTSLLRHKIGGTADTPSPLARTRIRGAMIRPR